jgi:pimeloyl-ACP methyl ester carboxylesterase
MMKYHLTIAVVLTIALHTACRSSPSSNNLHEPVPGKRIEQARYLVVGGIEQWITIRGDDDNNPVLLLVHGGPGDVQSPLVSTYAPYEHDFVLVQWDQRGAGRTFAKNGASGLSLEQQIADGIDLAAQLHRQFPDRALIVFGHSWGSVIATGMAQRRPELFAAYVGTGQVAAWADTVQFQFDFLKDAARKRNDAATLAELEAIGKPDPTNVKQYFKFSWPIRKNMSAADTGWLTGLSALATANGETEASLELIGKGMGASGEALSEASIRTDLPASATSFSIPYYVIQGRHDLFTPTSLAEAYFAKIVAPRKQMIVFEDAGHFALATHAQQVAAALKKLL